MARIHSFETAAARRRRDPIIIEIDEQQFRCRASVDISEIAQAQDLMTDETDEALSFSERIARQKSNLIAAFRIMVEPDDHDALDGIAADLDFRVLGDVIRELVREYVGSANPTKPAESSAGSSATGSSSTGGAPLAE